MSYERAIAAIDLKRWDVAVREMTAALADDPLDAHAWSALAFCEYNLGDTERAADSARNALMYDAGDCDSLYLLAVIHLSKDQLTHSEDAIKQALALLPKQPEYLVLFAELQFRGGKRDFGFSVLDQALSAEPTNLCVLTSKIHHLMQSGKFDECRDLKERAMALYPNDARLHALVGVEKMMEGNSSQATLSFLEALRLRPTDSGYVKALQESQRDSSGAAKVSVGFCALTLLVSVPSIVLIHQYPLLIKDNVVVHAFLLISVVVTFTIVFVILPVKLRAIVMTRLSEHIDALQSMA